MCEVASRIKRTDEDDRCKKIRIGNKQIVVVPSSYKQCYTKVMRIINNLIETKNQFIFIMFAINELIFKTFLKR